MQLHRLGREYPDPNYHFLPKLRAMFRKNAHLTDDKEIESKLKLAEFVKKETESTSPYLCSAVPTEKVPHTAPSVRCASNTVTSSKAPSAPHQDAARLS